MAYQEYTPGKLLQPFVKCYYLYESDTDGVLEDKALATGCIELMFNLGTGRWQTISGGHATTTPMIELWGQIIEPLHFRSQGKNTMLGARFYPHTASLFLQPNISEFNNQVTDYTAIADKAVQTLHQQLLEAGTTRARLALLEAYLLQRLTQLEKKLPKPRLIGKVIEEMQQSDFFDNINNVADRYGITSRYLQKLFLQHTGLTPKLYNQVHRFQNSLQLIAQQHQSLTAIAYACGYFDQSHFIREFKSFAGVNPSAFDTANTSAVLISANQ